MHMVADLLGAIHILKCNFLWSLSLMMFSPINLCSHVSQSFILSKCAEIIAAAANLQRSSAHQAYHIGDTLKEQRSVILKRMQHNPMYVYCT